MAATGPTVHTVKHVLSQSGDHKRLLDSNNQLARVIGDMLKVGGELEQAIGNDEFMNEQRQRLVALTEMTVQDERQVQAFVQTLNELKTGLEDGSVVVDMETTDFETMIPERLNATKASLETTYLTMEQEAPVRDIRNVLGLGNPSGRAVGGRNGEDSDEDLEIVEAGSNAESFKCPISMTLLVDPYRSTICKHVYSKESLLSYLQQKNGVGLCPVAGCRNRQLTMDQCRPDQQMVYRVKRHVRREQQAKGERLAQQFQVDEDDDEEEDEDGNSV